MTNRRSMLCGAAGIALWLAGCAQVSQVATGQVVVRQRLIVDVEKDWNQFEFTLDDGTPTWTQDGIAVDALKFYVGLSSGDLLAPTPTQPKGQQPLAYKADMQASDIVALFERMYSRGGSTFTLDKVVPTTFVGTDGYRFEFSSIRKADDVRLRGVAWFAVRGAQLWAITYTAPRLAFFPAGVPSAEAIARSARIKA
jgi:hypothetical protein